MEHSLRYRDHPASRRHAYWGKRLPPKKCVLGISGVEMEQEWMEHGREQGVLRASQTRQTAWRQMPPQTGRSREKVWRGRGRKGGKLTPGVSPSQVLAPGMPRCISMPRGFHILRERFVPDPEPRSSLD